MDTPDKPLRKQQELRLFLMITVVLAPVLSIAIVGGFGFAIWFGQILSQ